MSSSRPHPLPAPVVHAGFAVSQSKSYVLAGVQDAYWSDDEAEDAECPLCSEEMDISDLNFKPCICGYQICRFCWHHIKENLNKRCPACRRVYSDEAVEFKPIPTQDHKRLTQQKKQRERERKELDILGRRHLANVRVVQRNVVYITGIGSRFAKEELIPTLRSNEYFGQYGKITKILLVKRTQGGGNSVVGLYITYHRKEDAVRCIASVDGTASPSGGREALRASYGTTKYCMAFLRGVSCSDHSCMNLHEWGDEKDCFTKEDLTTLKHTMKTTETRARNAGISTKKGEEPDASLPRAAGWGQKTLAVPGNSTTLNIGVSARQPRRGAPMRQQRTSSGIASASNETRAANARAAVQDPKTLITMKSSSQTSSPTPSLSSAQPQVASAIEAKTTRTKKEPTQPALSRSPAPSSLADSDAESGLQASVPHSLPDRPVPTEAIQPSLTSPLLPPGLAAINPTPSAPPGLPSPSRPPRLETASPQTPLLASQSSYQMSNAARALLDDVKARWESALPATMGPSPFPDFDRTLQTLSGGNHGGFSFNLDPKLAGNEGENVPLPDFTIGASLPFRGSYIDPFPALRTSFESIPTLTTPPGLPYPHHKNRLIYDPLSARMSPAPSLEKEISGYMGSFNPFADGAEEPTPSIDVTSRRPHDAAFDDDSSRKLSRFGFARGRQVPPASSLHVPSPLNTVNNDIQTHASNELPAQHQWTKNAQQDFGQTQKSSATSSPSLQQPAPPDFFPPQQTGFRSFGSSITEAQLRDFIQASKDRVLNINGNDGRPLSNVISHSTQFNDPAIVSTPFTSPTPDVLYNHLSYGPPPGLSFPHGPIQSVSPNVHAANGSESDSSGQDVDASTTSPVLSLTLSAADFPALTAIPIEANAGEVLPTSGNIDGKPLEKSQRKSFKKAAVVEKAAERQKVAQERAAARATERAKVAQEKAVEKEKAMVCKAQEKTAKELMEKVKTLKVTKSEIGQTSHLGQSLVIENEKGKGSHSKKAVTKPSVSNRLNGIEKPLKPTLTSSPLADPTPQVPILSKKPKKNKPIAKPIKVSKEDAFHDEMMSTIPSTADGPLLPTDSSSNDSRSHSLDRSTPTPIEDLLEEIDMFNPGMDLPNHPFFDSHKLNSTATTPLEYGPLVHALSALSVGGGSFANNMPSGSIDNAVSSFQQLLETLTQTISDLLRLLPRTTWDDSSSFDGVLRDMLKGDDFLDDAGDEGRGKEDEVAALTLALERRARWMEVQLSKLEELHRDINTAAVRAVLSFNDNGWDRHMFLPRVGNSLHRFDSIRFGLIEEDGAVRSMSSAELEEKLAVAREAAVFAEAEVREVMERIQLIRPADTPLSYTV